MSAPAVMVYTSWCQAERRAVSRHRIDYGHRATVMLARACWVATHGSLPTWTPGPGLRTVSPHTERGQ